MIRTLLRFALNLKGLAYKTEWIHYPDIEAFCLKIGAKASDVKQDGRPHYTLPVIYDPSTKLVISDSPVIVQYLDKQYPNTPKLFPYGTQGLIYAFGAASGPPIGHNIYRLLVFGVWKILEPASQPYFRATRELTFGAKLEDIVPSYGEEKAWKALEDGFQLVSSWYDANAEGSLFIFGDSITFADVIIAGRLIWARVTFGEDSKEWATIAGWQNGRWGKFLKNFEKYETVV